MKRMIPDGRDPVTETETVRLMDVAIDLSSSNLSENSSSFKRMGDSHTLKVFKAIRKCCVCDAFVGSCDPRLVSR